MSWGPSVLSDGRGCPRRTEPRAAGSSTRDTPGDADKSSFQEGKGWRQQLIGVA